MSTSPNYSWADDAMVCPALSFDLTLSLCPGPPMAESSPSRKRTVRLASFSGRYRWWVTENRSPFRDPFQ